MGCNLSYSANRKCKMLQTQQSHFIERRTTWALNLTSFRMGKPYVSNIEKNAGKLNFELRNCLRWLLLMQNSIGALQSFLHNWKISKIGILKKGVCSYVSVCGQRASIICNPDFLFKRSSNQQWSMITHENPMWRIEARSEESEYKYRALVYASQQAY